MMLSSGKKGFTLSWSPFNLLSGCVSEPITNLFVKGKAINICCSQENFVFMEKMSGKIPQAKQ